MKIEKGELEDPIEEDANAFYALEEQKRQDAEKMLELL